MNPWIKKNLAIILVVASMFTTVLLGAVYLTRVSNQPIVVDFQTCAEATGMISKSYPPKCYYNGVTYTEEIDDKMNMPSDPGEIIEELPVEEKDLIEAWLGANGLNKYGDTPDTMYAGGTPLFDELTSETISLYDYLVRKYPTKPWLKQDSSSAPETDSLQENVLESSKVISFSQINEWASFEDPQFIIDYPVSPIEVQVADANGYPIRMFSDDGFEVFLGIGKNPKPNFACTQKNLLDSQLFICHNENARYLSVYEYMIETFTLR